MVCNSFYAVYKHKYNFSELQAKCCFDQLISNLEVTVKTRHLTLLRQTLVTLSLNDTQVMN